MALTFRKICLPCRTTLPAVRKFLQRTVCTCCALLVRADTTRRKPMYRLWVKRPGKERRVGGNVPHGIYSMPKPVFKSLMRFSLASPRLLYHCSVSAAVSPTRLLAIA